MRKFCLRGIFVFSIIFLISPAWAGYTVMRDTYGIPTIEADTEEELFEQFGYVTATDRLWQMEVNKRFGRGTLAEIFGPKLVPSDMQTRLMGYTEAEYQAMLEKVSPHVRMMIAAYFRGVNRRIDEVLNKPELLPMEYLALKIKPQHFTEIDFMAFFKALLRRFGMVGGGELKNFAALQTLTERFGKRDGLAVFNDWCWLNDPSAPTYIQESITEDFVPGSTMVSEVPSYLSRDRELAGLVEQCKKMSQETWAEAKAIGAPVVMGSNSWTLSPEVTGTGYPILVGQPQMGHSVPSIIMEIHLKGGRYDVAGMVFPLLPPITIGHNRHVAWSHMVGMCDNVDVYQEVLNPLNKEEYLHKGAWRRMESRIEKIAVAGGEAKTIKIYRTIHGPVISPFPFDPESVSEDHVYSQKLAHWLKEPLSGEGWFRMMAAKNAQEFSAGAAHIMTSLHTTYADTEGNIGYWHTGLNPERTQGFDPRLPLPGTGEAEWTGRFLPNAFVLNPSKGYVTGWNNKSSPDTRNPFSVEPNYHSFGRYHRALWLERSIAGRKDLNLAANKELMRYVGVAGTWKDNIHNALGGSCKDLLPTIVKAAAKADQSEKPLLDKVVAVLAAWDGRSVKDAVSDEKYQAGQTILLDWLPRLIKATFGDELDGVEEFDAINMRIYGLFLRCLDGATSPLPVSRNYFDSMATQQEETAEDVFLQTLRETATHLKQEFQSEDPATWQGPRAKIIFKHNMFGQVAEMWDNNIGTYIQIVELRPEGAVGYSRWPMGQSGFIKPGPDKRPVFDPHFFDMLPLYKGYTYQKMGFE
jgi:penicillin amidase